MRLTETIWEPGTHPALDTAYESAWQDEEPYEPERRWAVHLTGNPPRIVMSMRYREEHNDFPTLQSYLDQQAPVTLLDHLFVVDSYYQSRVLDKPLATDQSINFTPDPIIDELLAASDGILLWQFQFEQLAQLFADRRSEAIELRRRINQKRPEAKERIGEMVFPSGQSLREVVEERLLYEGVVPGQWRSAQLLFHGSN